MQTNHSKQNNPLDNWRVILAACVASAVGAMIYNVLPLFVGAAQDDRGLSNQNVGFVVSMFFVGFGTVASSSYFWIRHVNWQLATFLAILSSTIGLTFIALTESYTSLLIGIMVAGGALGFIYGIGTTILGDTSNPARYYGVKIGSEASMGIFLLLTLPIYVIAQWGFEGLLYALTGLTLLLSITFIWVPKAGVKGKDDSERKETGRTSTVAILSSLLGIFTFFSGMSAVWTYMERLGVDAGFTNATIGQILSLSLFLALFGAVLAATIADKFNRIFPLLVGLLTVLVSEFLFSMQLTLSIYAVAACLFNMAFAFTLSFLVTLTADLDFNGRFVVLTVPAIAFGNVVGPAVAGSLIGEHGYTGVMLLAEFTIVITCVLIIIAIKTGLASTNITGMRSEGPLI